MEWDHLAEEQSQRIFAGWLKLLLGQSPELPMQLAEKHRPGAHATEVSKFTTGSYNMCCTVSFEDGSCVLIRFPILGRSRFRREKTGNEVLLMGFLARKTQIPLPVLIGCGNWACGPYIVMSFIEGKLLSKCLRDPSVESPSLSPNVSDSDLERAYRGMAQILLELSKVKFPSIGSVGWEAFKWKVAKRPLSLGMNELVRVGNYPPSELPEHRFATGYDYFQELARRQFLHLKYQRNNAVKDELDCQKKYISRCLFRKIVQQTSFKPGPYHLYCDDFRPSNVLVSESDFTVTGVIDWEFTYIAPVEFTETAPWWLLFESPEGWEQDLNQFLLRYRPRLQLFLKVLRACEEENGLEGPWRLSDKMAESMENGLFWICLAATRNFMFDDIYWTFLHELYYPNASTLDKQLSLLSPEERDEMAGFVQTKLQQAEEKTLDEHQTFDEIFDS